MEDEEGRVLETTRHCSAQQHRECLCERGPNRTILSVAANGGRSIAGREALAGLARLRSSNVGIGGGNSAAVVCWLGATSLAPGSMQHRWPRRGCSRAGRQCVPESCGEAAKEGPRTVLEVHGFTRAVVGILAVVAICHQAEGGNVSTHRFLSSSPASTVVLLVDGDSGSPLTTHNGQCGLSASTACATVRAAAAMAARPEYANAHIHIQIAAGQYGADSCNAVFNQPVSLTGAGSAATKIDCGFTSRFLHVNGTQSSLMVSGLSVYNCTSYYNAMEAGGVVDGGAVLVTWGSDGNGDAQGLYLNFEAVVFVGARAALNASAGHEGIHTVGGAIGVVLPIGNVSDVVLDVVDCQFYNMVAAGGARASCRDPVSRAEK